MISVRNSNIKLQTAVHLAELRLNVIIKSVATFISEHAFNKHYSLNGIAACVTNTFLGIADFMKFSYLLTMFWEEL